MSGRGEDSIQSPFAHHDSRFLLSGAFPAVAVLLCLGIHHQTAGTRVFPHRGAGAYRSAFRDGHGRDELHVRAYVHAVLDHRAVLVGAVVIAGNGARADVDLRPTVESPMYER